MEIIKPLIQYLAVIILSPLLLGLINRVKAKFAGRRGQPLLQLYFDLYKLSYKTPVYSRTTTWLFRAGPVIGLSAILCALAALPFAGRPGFLAFDGDFIFLIYLLGLGRFFTVLAALDTGSSFEGMGASREVQFAVFSEPAFFLALAALSKATGKLSLSGMFLALEPASWQAAAPALLLLTAALFIILLAENSRVQVDDPNTHLELTMIHEVMVLDHSGPYFGCILYGAALKLYLLGALFTNIAVPFSAGNSYLDWGIFALAMLALAVAIGVVESVMARLRLIRVPQLLIAAMILTAFSLVLVVR